MLFSVKQHWNASIPSPPLLFVVTESSVEQHLPTSIPVLVLFDELTFLITTQHELLRSIPTLKLLSLPFAIAIDSRWWPPSEIPSPVPLPLIECFFISSETPSTVIVMQVPAEVRFLVST